jgi:protein disulfide-isomerase A1
LKKLQDANEAVVLGVFGSDTDTHATAFKEFTGASKVELAFAMTSSPDLLKHLDAKANTIVVLKDFIFDDKRSDFTDYDSSKNDEVEAFLGTATTPLIQEFTQDKSNKIFGSVIRKHVLVFTDSNQTYHTKTIEAIKGVAQSYKGQVLVVTIPVDNKGILGYFELEEKDCPKVIVVDMEKNMKKYPLEGDITADNISNHVKSFFAGDLKPHLKSEEPTPADIAGPVKVVKGKNFKEMILDSDHDVMLEIYAPWCGHCKKLGK